MTMPDRELLPLLAVTAEVPARAVELVDGTGASLPLAAVEIDAGICGLDARLAVRHTFTNTLHRPITATYLFPLLPRAAVRAFVTTFAGRVVRARIDERDASWTRPVHRC
jgi:Vault protein inter-alpha-trypsin domain